MVIMGGLAVGTVWITALQPAGFVVGWVLWTAAPVVASVPLARRRRAGLLPPLVAAAFFGWLGLAAVALTDPQLSGRT